MWPNSELLRLLGIDIPIIQAPMAGASGSDMAVAVCEAGGLGSLPCAMLDAATASKEIAAIRQRTSKPFNLNFFCHASSSPDPDRESAWKKRLSSYYSQFGLDQNKSVSSVNRAPFDAVMCEIVEKLTPEVVSFHFGLPERSLLNRVKESGSFVISTATTVEEAKWLEGQGCDAIIAQGCEAGGHRGMFLTDDIASQPGTIALVPQVVDAVNVPVIAAGGIADGRGIAAALALGAAGVQIGTAYLLTPESLITDLHRVALGNAGDDQTAITNVFTGRPARGLLNRVMREVGPMSDEVPAFPMAGGALAPLKSIAESQGSADFSSLWSGQAASMARELSAHELTQCLANDAQDVLNRLTSSK